MWFTRKHSPTIINQTNHSIVVFQERGILYNKQVLLPGEAVSMTPSQTTGNVPLLPYFIHAVVGDERALPTRYQSVKNLVCVSVIPAAFICATLATASTAGAAAAPSTAMMSMLRGVVIKGVVIDSAAMAAGALAANRVAFVSDLLLKKHPTKFMAKSGKMSPGKRFVIVTGGLDEGTLTITIIKERQFRKLDIKHFKEPTDTIKDKIHYYIPVLAPPKAPVAPLPQSATEYLSNSIPIEPIHEATPMRNGRTQRKRGRTFFCCRKRSSN